MATHARRRSSVVTMAENTVTETSELVHLHVVDGVATITLDSPDNRNALSAQLRRELTAHLATTAADDAVRVVVLDHTGHVFCAGMDLRESRGAGPSAQGVNEFPQILEALWRHPKPVIAALSGLARAGGVGLVAACDIAVASTAASFAFSEVRLGLVPAVISVAVLPRLAPRAAQELFLTGDVFSAERAAEIGLLTAAVAPEDLRERVLHYVTALGKGAPLALTRTKELLSAGTADGMGARFGEMLELSAGFFAAPEAQEGMTAFAEKRPASWVPTHTIGAQGAVGQSSRTR
jgi:methylglutaconyl-CoA hydratase